MNPDKTFRLKHGHGVTTISDDDTTLYASVFDGVQLVANIPIMINIIVNIQKDSITVLLPEVSPCVICKYYTILYRA